MSIANELCSEVSSVLFTKTMDQTQLRQRLKILLDIHKVLREVSKEASKKGSCLRVNKEEECYGNFA
jgi:hypothetical protein